MQAIDQVDQLAMLVVDRNVADAEFRSPFDQAHRKLKPPASARNVTVK
jgi:hypothetical protein